MKLSLHGQTVETVFDIIGDNENAMTQSLGWVLSKCPIFLNTLAEHLQISQGFSDSTRIYLQEYKSEKGFTDLEIIDPGKHHIIIEAKCGFTIPSTAQMEKYADRLLSSVDAPHKLLVILAESDREEAWLPLQLPETVKDISLASLSWREFQNAACSCIIKSNHAQKRLLRQFISYLDKVTTMQNQYSNLVYVVSLSRNTFSDADINFVDVVEKHRKYFHAVGGGKGGWPTEPPNYMGFRYDGKLQSIHHIESYTVIEDYHPHFDVPSPSPCGEPHFLYTLGPAIHPPKDTPTNCPDGNHRIYPSGRKWCFLDLLLTSNSVAEAAHLTHQRRNKYETLEAA